MEEPLFKLSYQIDLDSYLYFNRCIAEEMFQRRRKRSTIIGWIEIVVGALLLISMINSPQEKNPLLMVIVAAAVMLMGLYSVVFFKYWFPRQLERAARKQYETNAYLKNPIELDFYPGCVVERSLETETIREWPEFKKLEINDRLLMLMLGEARCVLVPLKEIREEDVNRIREIYTQAKEEE